MGGVAGSGHSDDQVLGLALGKLGEGDLGNESLLALSNAGIKTHCSPKRLGGDDEVQLINCGVNPRDVVKFARLSICHELTISRRGSVRAAAASSRRLWVD